jgi:hypothetical protein
MDKRAKKLETTQQIIEHLKNFMLENKPKVYIDDLLRETAKFRVKIEENS